MSFIPRTNGTDGFAVAGLNSLEHPVQFDARDQVGVGGK
jgi:hypothetical protein